jgi:hypothetical protein
MVQKLQTFVTIDALFMVYPSLLIQSYPYRHSLRGEIFSPLADLLFVPLVLLGNK